MVNRNRFLHSKQWLYRTPMEMYFKLVLKNKDKNEILWCISKIDDIKFINFSVDYLLNEQILTKKEVLQAIKKNPRLEKLEI